MQAIAQAIVPGSWNSPAFWSPVSWKRSLTARMPTATTVTRSSSQFSLALATPSSAPLPVLQALPQECLPPDILEPGILDEFFDRMDANCDGRLSFEEFKAAIHADHFLVDALLQPARGESPGVRPPARTPGFKDSTW